MRARRFRATNGRRAPVCARGPASARSGFVRSVAVASLKHVYCGVVSHLKRVWHLECNALFGLHSAKSVIVHPRCAFWRRGPLSRDDRRRRADDDRGARDATVGGVFIGVFIGLGGAPWR